MGGDAHDLLAVAVEVVRDAARLAQDLREQGVSGVSTKSTATDVVTAADKATERYVRDALRERRPGDTVLGEESGESAGTGRVRWIVDPIDGTVNFAHGLPIWSIAISLERGGETILGVVNTIAERTGARPSGWLGPGLSESIDTSTPMGKTIFTVLGAVAELERNLIKERVNMGISRARKQGKALGRPRVEVDPLQVAGLRSLGLSWNQIADKLGIGRGTAERAFKSLSQKPLRTLDNVGHIQ